MQTKGSFAVVALVCVLLGCVVGAVATTAVLGRFVISRGDGTLMRVDRLSGVCWTIQDAEWHPIAQATKPWTSRR